MRRYLLTIFVLCILITGVKPPTACAEPMPQINVLIDELPVKFDVQPVIKDGRTLVPFRALAESLNVKVNWDNTKKTVTAADNNTTIILNTGNTTAYINNKPLTLDVPPLILNGRTLIPLRIFSEAFKCKVDWDNSVKTVRIISPPKSMTVVGFYALGGGNSRSWDDLFGTPYPETTPCNTDIVGELGFGWYSLDQQGYLATQSTTGWKRPDGWQNVLNTIANYDIKPEMTVHLTDKDSAIVNILNNPASVNRAVYTITEEARLYYKGVNLNFEGLGYRENGEQLAKTRQKFNEFVTLLAKELHSAGLSLTLTIHPLNSAYPGYDYKSLGQAADCIIIMAHDYGPKPEPASLVIQAVTMALKEVPADKLILGVSIPSETPVSIISKIGIAKRYNLKGISLWRLGLVSDEIWNSLRQNIIPRIINAHE